MGFPESKLNNIFIEIHFDGLRMLQGGSRQCSKWPPFPTLSVSKGEPWWPWGLMSSVESPPPRRLADPSLSGLAFQTLWGLSHPDSSLFLLFSFPLGRPRLAGVM